jgi:opacity protein-like surface antigen
VKSKILIPALALAALLCVAPAEAQFNKDWQDWYGNVHGGYSVTQGDFSEAAKDGWTLGGGATYYPSDWLFGISLELNYSDYDLTDELKDFFESSGGDVDIWGLTTGLTWSPKLEGPVGFHLTGGVGGYYVKARLTEPAVVCGPICPPWSWWCYPGCVPGTAVTDSYSTTKFGYFLAAAIDFQVGMGNHIYVQAQFNSVETDTSTTYLPIVVGYRF